VLGVVAVAAGGGQVRDPSEQRDRGVEQTTGAGAPDPLDLPHRDAVPIGEGGRRDGGVGFEFGPQLSPPVVGGLVLGDAAQHVGRWQRPRRQLGRRVVAGDVGGGRWLQVGADQARPAGHIGLGDEGGGDGVEVEGGGGDVGQHRIVVPGSDQHLHVGGERGVAFLVAQLSPGDGQRVVQRIPVRECEGARPAGHLRFPPPLDDAVGGRGVGEFPGGAQGVAAAGGAVQQPHGVGEDAEAAEHHGEVGDVAVAGDVDGHSDGDRAGGQRSPAVGGFPEALPGVGEGSGDHAAEVDDGGEGGGQSRPPPPGHLVGPRRGCDGDPDLADGGAERGDDVEDPREAFGRRCWWAAAAPDQAGGVGLRGRGDGLRRHGSSCAVREGPSAPGCGTLGR
jgi:hypothetical protein